MLAETFLPLLLILPLALGAVSSNPSKSANFLRVAVNGLEVKILALHNLKNVLFFTSISFFFAELESIK